MALAVSQSYTVHLLYLHSSYCLFVCLQKVIYDFKSLENQILTSSDDAYTPVNGGLAVLLSEEFELTNENTRYYYND